VALVAAVSGRCAVLAGLTSTSGGTCAEGLEEELTGLANVAVCPVEESCGDRNSEVVFTAG
jgi:hypothetical protein